MAAPDDLKFLTEQHESMAFRRRGYERDALLQAMIERAGFTDLVDEADEQRRGGKDDEEGGNATEREHERRRVTHRYPGDVGEEGVEDGFALNRLTGSQFKIPAGPWGEQGTVSKQKVVPR